jgi:hypothetical protein
LVLTVKICNLQGEVQSRMQPDQGLSTAHSSRYLLGSATSSLGRDFNRPLRVLEKGLPDTPGFCCSMMGEQYIITSTILRDANLPS